MRNEFGKLVRNIREERNIRLYKMANDLGYSPSFLSAIENNRKSAPMEIVDKIIKYYNISSNDAKKLRDTAKQTIKSFTIEMNNPSISKINLAESLARSFDSLEDKDIKKIILILNKKEVAKLITTS